MSGVSENLSRRIAGAKDLAAVVRSMKALAASSIGQYELAVASLTSYYRTVQLGLTACLKADGLPLRILEKPRTASIGAIIVGSDQGLVGRFNEVLFSFAREELKSMDGKITHIWSVGDRMHELVADSALSPGPALPVPSSVDAITTLVDALLVDIEAARERGTVGMIRLFHNRPAAGAGYDPVSERLLPFDSVWLSSLISIPWPTRNPPQIIGDTATLEYFIREFLSVLLFRACAESLASENSTRLAAMQRAEKNIDEIRQQLDRRYHRLRQDSIDEELFDVVSGYELLSADSATEQH